MAARRPGKTSKSGQKAEKSWRNPGNPTAAPAKTISSPSPTNLVPENDKHGLFSRFSDLTLLPILVVIATLPNLNILRNGFVSDDEMQVLHNPYIRSFQHFLTFFTTPATSYVGVEAPKYYRPLMNVDYMLCYAVFGPRPLGFHLVSIALNAAVVCAVFLVTKRLLQSRDLALIAAVLFAVHPTHSEAVAWVAAVSDLQLSFFYLLTFWFFLSGARPQGKFSGLYALAMAGSFVLAICSKEQAVTLPLLATAYEHFYRADRAETRPAQKILRYGVLWILAGIYVLFRILILGGLSSGWGNQDLTWFETVLSAAMLLGQYVGKLLWPVNLRAFCPFQKPLGLLDWKVLAGIGAFAACCALFRYLWRNAHPISFGLVWTLALLAPVLNARWLPTVVYAERYLYLSSVGFCWVLGWGILRLRGRAAARGSALVHALAAAFGILIALCSWRVALRNRDWRDDFKLYAKTLAGCPDAYQIKRDLGAAYWQLGDVESAVREWQEALKIAPEYSKTWSSLGEAYLKQQRYAEAVEYDKKAIALDAGNPDGHLYLGIAYIATHSPQLAEPELQTAVSLAPLNPDARNALGELDLEEGRKDEAEEQFRQSIEIEPNLIAYGKLGLVRFQEGDFTAAEQNWQQALRLDPNDLFVLNNLGLVATGEGRYADAIGFFQKAIQLHPNEPSPHLNLGMTYARMRENAPAEQELLKAISLSPQQVEARNWLGMIYFNTGQVDKAQEQFLLSVKTRPNDWGYESLGETYLQRGDASAAESALRSATSVNPNNSKAHFQLGALYLGEGRNSEALTEYQAGLKNDPENHDALAAVARISH